MTDKDLIKRVAANHQNLTKAISEEAPIEDPDDALSAGIQSIAQRLKVVANKRGVMQMREAFALVGDLVMQLSVQGEISDQPAVKNAAKRLMRELKQTVMSVS